MSKTFQDLADLDILVSHYFKIKIWHMINPKIIIMSKANLDEKPSF